VRILHVVPSYLPAYRYGGTVFATHALCAALVRAGCAVTVFTTDVDGVGNSAVPLGVPVKRDGVEIRYFPSRWLRRLYYSPQMKRVLESECATFDIVHLHSVYLWPTWAAARAALRSRTPYLLAPRGMLVRELIERKSALVKKVWIRFIERGNVEHAAGIHVTSAAEADELARFGFRLPTVYEVPNGVATGRDEESAEALPRHVQDILKGDRQVILSLGRIHWKKGLDRLIGALVYVPEALLLIVGNDEEDYTPKLKKLAANAGVSGRVIFAKPVFGAAKTALYRKVALFALASYSENFGNVVVEAMAEGCPVVVTPEVGASGVVEESGGGIVASGEPAPFADALCRLLSDARLRAEMGGRGREWVCERYSWDQVAERMVDIYRLLIANGGRGVA